MPLSGRLLTAGMPSDEVKWLHRYLRQLGHAGIIPVEELNDESFDTGTAQAVAAFQKANDLQETGEVDARTAALINQRVAALGASERRVEGRIRFENAMPTAKLPLKLFGRGFGCADTLLDEAVTDEKGMYSLSYAADVQKLGLEIRALDGQGKEVSLSTPKYDAGDNEVLHLVAPATVGPQESEYQRLIADLEKQIKQRGELAKARETDDCRDVTLLHQATGWDARVIALAAKAEQHSATTKIDAEILYALFRTGLPPDPQRLALVDLELVRKALEKAVKAGIVQLNDQRIAEAVKAFETFARAVRRDVKAPGALSSVADLLGKSGLSDDEQVRFEDVYFARRGKALDLWEAAKQSGIAEAQIARLRTQGKLAYLTFDNAELTAALEGDLDGSADIGRLAELDLYGADAWKTRVRALAPDDGAVERLIPPAYLGSTADARLDAYADDLARKVRVSFPTRVVARLIEKGDIRLNGNKDTDEQSVVGFLRRAEPLGFQLGQVPVTTFIAEHREALFADQSPEQIEITTNAVKQLQRLYQITPSNDALALISRLGFTSALDVADFSHLEFMNRYADLFSSHAEAELVYGKAQQVTATTRELLTIVRQMDSMPPLYVLSPSRDSVAGAAASPDRGRAESTGRDVDLTETASRETAAARERLIRRFPTLESLFGSMDFCECEHCRSVLSPAAYFVDLLRFLDPETRATEWQSFLTEWARRHDGQTYTAAGYMTPYDALVDRRPDLPHLPLTCENTNTLLPYIDLVNEILEHWVAHSRLDAESVRDNAGTVTSELLTEPQNVIAAAYDTLAEASYPLALPFDLWLETVRRLLEHAQTPLWEVLDTLRTDDELFASAADGDDLQATDRQRYYRAAVFAERLGFSPEEYKLMTAGDRSERWHELYGYAAASEAIRELASAKTLARRLGVSYQELVDLVRTGFLNRKLEKLAVLQRHRIDVQSVARYLGMPGYAPLATEDRDAFVRRLNELGLTDWLDAAARARAFDGILLLAGPARGCDFSQTALKYLNIPDEDAGPRLAFDLLKLNLFVRLWRKLGWTIDETDRALQVFVPASSRALTWSNIGPAFATVLLYVAHLDAIEKRLALGRDGRHKLLTLWSDLPTTGTDPLYGRLFLKPSVPRSDPAFDSAVGQYLQYRSGGEYREFRWDAGQPEDVATGNVPLETHLQAVQEAFGLSTTDIGRILSSVRGRSPVDTEVVRRAEPLTLPTVSVLHRYGLLAKALQLRVNDLLTLKELSGLDPFEPLSPAPVINASDDRPLERTLRFLDIAEQVKASGVQIEDLDYLLRHQFDPVGRHRPDPNAAATLTSTLSAELRRIRAEHPIPPESASDADAGEAAVLSDDAIRRELGIVLPPDAVDLFLAMWSGAVQFRAEQEGVAPDDRLEEATFARYPAVRIGYDAVRHLQWLTYHGVLSDAARDTLLTTVEEPRRARLRRLLEAVQQQARDARESLRTHFVRESEPLAGLLESSAFERLFAPPENVPDDLPEADQQVLRRRNDLQLREKRRLLARALMPVVQRQLTRELVVRTLSTALNSDPTLVDALVADTSIVADPSRPAADAGARRTPLLDAFADSAAEGITATFFSSPDATGPSNGTRTVAEIDTTTTNGPNRPAGAASARLSAYLKAPATGAYRFTARLDRSGAEIELRVGHLADPLVRGQAVRDGDQFGGFLELRAGVLYAFTLDARRLGNGGVTLLVQSERLPQGSLARLVLHPLAVVDRIARARLLLAKALQLIQALRLSARELRYLRAHADDFDAFDLTGLPTEPQPAGATATARFTQFLRLAGYVRLRGDLAGATEDLIDVFERARGSYGSSVTTSEAERRLTTELFGRIAELTRRDAGTVRAVAAHYDFVARSTREGDLLRMEIPALAQERGLRRLWEGLRVIERLSTPVDTVVQWTGIVRSERIPADHARRADIARAVRSVVKARYEPERYRQVAQPIFDALRRRQRDALVARVMHQHPEGFESTDELFEYFLVDPGMEPVVQTSRLRLAISSLQLFVQRCLLNLETKVHASAIDAGQWEWMKRYRVWEANRKIYLYPENYLEPELRMGRTHIGRELEASLLREDISEDSAQDAFFRYLSELDTIARLQIVTMCRDASHGSAQSALHVIGRTYNEPRKYFYRRYAHGRWTPWEPVAVEIEADHVAAVVWRGRLHVFWCTFLERAEAPNSTPRDAADRNVASAIQRQVDIQVSWAEYFQGVWTTRKAGGFGRASSIHVNVPHEFDHRSVAIHISKDGDGEREGPVRVHLNGHFEEFISLSLGTPLGAGAAAGAGSGVLLSPFVVLRQPFARAFRVRGRNGAPEPVAGARLPALPYVGPTAEASVHRGAGALRITSAAGDSRSRDHLDILARGDDFTLVFESTPPRAATQDPATYGSFFYQDNRHAFFVEPAFTDIPVMRWDDWGVSGGVLRLFDQVQHGILDASIAAQGPISASAITDDPVGPYARYQLQVGHDWLASGETVIPFDQSLVSQSGG